MKEPVEVPVMAKFSEAPKSIPSGAITRELPVEENTSTGDALPQATEVIATAPPQAQGAPKSIEATQVTAWPQTFQGTELGAIPASDEAETQLEGSAGWAAQLPPPQPGVHALLYETAPEPSRPHTSAHNEGTGAAIQPFAGAEALPELGTISAGQQVGPYRILRRLGVGGMAEVFLAEQLGPAGFRKEIVVKRILPHLHFHSENVELFLREAKTAARLSHPNVVQIFDLGSDARGYYLAMEYVDGLTTYDMMRYAWGNGESVPINVVVTVLADAARGLHHAHELRDESGQPVGLVHRDISPDNLMLSRAGVTKVLDFGIAKGAQSPTVTRTGELKGKIPYMSPEQIRCEPLDRRSDLYSLGVILYWMLSGERPFVGTSEFVIMNAIIHDPPAPVLEKNPGVPASLAQVVSRLLSKSAADRFATGLELAEALEAAVPTSHDAAAKFASQMLERQKAGGTQRANSLPGMPAALLLPSGQVEQSTPAQHVPEARGQSHQETNVQSERSIRHIAADADSDSSSKPLPMGTVVLRGTLSRRKEALHRLGTVVLRGTLSRRKEALHRRKRTRQIGIGAGIVGCLSLFAWAWLGTDVDLDERAAVLGPTNTDTVVPVTESSGSLATGVGAPGVAGSALASTEGGSPQASAETAGAMPSSATSRNEATEPQPSSRSRRTPTPPEATTENATLRRLGESKDSQLDGLGSSKSTRRTKLARASQSSRTSGNDSRDPAPSREAPSVSTSSARSMRNVRLKAPKRIEWRTPDGKSLGRGSREVSVPENIDILLAYDTLRQVSTRMPLNSDGVNYANAPRGRLEVRLFPYGDVYLGKEKLGTTPFAPVPLVVGTYSLRIVYDGNERSAQADISQGQTTTIKMNLTTP